MDKEEFKRVLSESFSLSAAGRTSRRMFWLAQLVYLAIYIVLFLATAPLGQFGAFASLAVSVVVMIVSWLLLIRRLHDIGKSGWWSLLILVPVVGLVAIMIFGFAQSAPGANRWGENPAGLDLIRSLEER